MPHARNRNPSPIPEVTWDTGLKEMNETWKGAIACLGVAVFFVMTIGIIYWQVVDQPNKNWILRGTFSGLIWERRTQSLVIQTLTEDKTYVEIDVGNAGNPDVEVPFVRNLCWLNKTEFCYTWDSVAEVKISLEVNEETETECYSMTWAPVHCHVELKVGLLSVRAQQPLTKTQQKQKVTFYAQISARSPLYTTTRGHCYLACTCARLLCYCTVSNQRMCQRPV